MDDVNCAHYDTADYLKTEADIAAYLEAVMVEIGDDPACITRALEAVARARKTICVSPSWFGHRATVEDELKGCKNNDNLQNYYVCHYARLHLGIMWQQCAC